MEATEALALLERLATAFDAEPSDARLILYAERLTTYDLEVARCAVEVCIDTSRFWPSWAELRQACDDVRLAPELIALPAEATWTPEDERAARETMTKVLAEYRARHPLAQMLSRPVKWREASLLDEQGCTCGERGQCAFCRSRP